MKVANTITAKVTWPNHYEFLEDDFTPLIYDINARIDPAFGPKIMDEAGEYIVDENGER